MFSLKQNKGFTLIELLVVISIISLLSSVVLSSLNGARNKAKLSKFIQQIEQFTIVMELEYSNTGTYAGLNSYISGPANGAWLATAAECDMEYGPGSGRTSTLLANTDSICKSIVATSNDTYSLMVWGNSSHYSVQGWFNPNQLLYCMGSRGKTLGVPYDGTVYNNIGCSTYESNTP